ncbi:hypothetical protein ACGF3G_51365 [Streptomyces sp. NPDC048179]|uniref:hypothetical protein n=1 Tax=Streptomyces sp. NPDC048179 TaxID=3365506 RepID=UPI00371A2E14
MKSVVAFLPSNVTIEDVRGQLLACGINAGLRDSRITASREGSVSWIEPDLEGELERECDPDELSFVAELIGEWIAFVIDYRTIDLAEVMRERWPCVVDAGGDFIGWAADYLKSRRELGGKIIGRDGKLISGDIKVNDYDAHIPLTDWLQWKTWNSPTWQTSNFPK